MPKERRVEASVSVIPRSNVWDRNREARDEVVLTAETVAAVFGMRLVDAARSLGVSSTTLKVCCRRLGIRRWPFSRTIRRLSRQVGGALWCADSRGAEEETDLWCADSRGAEEGTDLWCADSRGAEEETDLWFLADTRGADEGSDLGFLGSESSQRVRH